MVYLLVEQVTTHINRFRLQPRSGYQNRFRKEH